MNHSTKPGEQETDRIGGGGIPRQGTPARHPDMFGRTMLEDRLRAVTEVDRAILAGGLSDEVLRLVAHRARLLVDAAVTMVLLPEKSGDLTVRAAEGGDTDLLQGMHMPGRAMLAGAIMFSGEARLVPDVPPVPRPDLVVAQRFGPTLFVPLKVRARVVAVIQVANNPGGRQFGDDEFETLRIFAAQIGLALETHLSERAALLDGLSLEHRSAEVRARLRRLPAVSLEKRDLLRQTLDTLAQTVVELTDTVACSFQLLEPDGHVQTSGSYGLPAELVQEMEEADLRGAPSPALETVTSGAHVIVVNERERMLADSRYGPAHHLVRQVEWTAVGCLPLLSQNGNPGALCYYFRPEQRPGEADHRSLEVVAAQAATVVDNARLLATANERVALEERQHLARELHDSVSQALYGIALGARTTLEQLEHDPSRAREPLSYVLQLAETGLAEMRALIFELRPESLQAEGLAAALLKQGDAVRARHGIDVEAVIDPVPASAIETHEALYRIAQEALNNAARHAAAHHVELRLTAHDADLQLDVRDDGSGFDPDATFPGHLGLLTMRERAVALGGDLRVSSTPAVGTHVTATVPRFPPHGLPHG